MCSSINEGNTRKGLEEFEKIKGVEKNSNSIPLDLFDKIRKDPSQEFQPLKVE